jgi:hypothetical protein
LDWFYHLWDMVNTAVVHDHYGVRVYYAPSSNLLFCGYDVTKW